MSKYNIPTQYHQQVNTTNKARVVSSCIGWKHFPRVMLLIIIISSNVLVCFYDVTNKYDWLNGQAAFETETQHVQT